MADKMSLPGCGATKGSAGTVEFYRVDVGGTMVNFPFTPYPLQVDYMKKVLECLTDGKNGLLESPTGTGKTLSLLCSSLAWLEKARAAAQMAKLQLNREPPDAGGGGEWVAGGGPRHKIIYSSRTHSQLSQAVAELSRTSYRYMKVAILGSRDQLCVNPSVVEAQTSGEKLAMCQAKVKSRTCMWHTNVEKAKDRPEVRESQIMDIEELHKLGKKLNFCPYYMSRELYQSADVIFLPYNYLLDHSIRKSLDIDFNGALIIFDEAHNVTKMCEETASVKISSQDIALAVKDVDDVREQLQNPQLGFDEADVAPKDLRETELLVMKDILLSVEKELSSMLAGKSSLTLPGNMIHEMFSSFRDPGLIQTLELLTEFITSSNATTFSAKGKGVSKLKEFINGAFNENVRPEDLKNLYKVYVAKDEKTEGGKGFLKTKSENVILNLWCFSPGFSMRGLAKLGARSIILTSGTLSPLAATAEEIGIPFPVQLENQHIVTASQVWCGVLGTGPDGTPLNSSFKSRSDPKYLNSLGQAVINLIKIVPKGVLIFFPSYSLLNSTRENWQNSGIWSRIDSIKKILVEPQRKDALAIAMRDYYEEVMTGNGGCFMAVCRGKVAEGLDFADDNGRAVLVTGLPYPPFKDPWVELKRKFLDDKVREGGGQVSGQKWYGLEAFRATNQAIGRVIRHSRDHGAVIFLDQRFGDHQAKVSLSRWLQPFFQKYPNLGSAIKSVAGFFKVDSAVGSLRQAAIAAQTLKIECVAMSSERLVVSPVIVSSTLSDHPILHLLNPLFRLILSPRTPHDTLQFPTQGCSCLLVDPASSVLTTSSLETCSQFLAGSTNPFILLTPRTSQTSPPDDQVNMSHLSLQLTLQLSKMTSDQKPPLVVSASDPAVGLACILKLVHLPKAEVRQRFEAAASRPSRDLVADTLRALTVSGLCKDRVDSMLLLDQVGRLDMIKGRMDQLDHRTKQALEQNLALEQDEEFVNMKPATK